MLKHHAALLLVTTIVISACGGGDDDGGPGAGPDAAAEASWQAIIAGEWSLEPGQEDWYCASRTLDEDLYVGAFRPIDPIGTHHTVMTFGQPSGPDQQAAPCDPDSMQPNAIYASGVNTNEMELPSGVGFKIAAGEQVHLNLHVFNTTDEVLSGASGVEIRPLPAEELEHEAELFLPGPLGFEIPRDQEYSYSSECEILEDQHIFALFPHMHQLGRRFKTEITVGGETTALWDEDYRFEEQVFTVFEPIALAPGDRITTTCTWSRTAEDDLPDVVRLGDSSKEEMCFSIMMRYPRLHSPEDEFCTDEKLEDPDGD